MKKILVVRTRWEYYAANIAGLVSILALFIWFLSMSIHTNGLDFKSVFFWLALLLLLIAPYAAIGFFSSMKTVEVTATGLIISYIFQKHTNVIQFSEVAEMKSPRTGNKTTARSRAMRETFKLVLADNRVFEFERAQFDHYVQLKTLCDRKINRN